MKRDWDIDHIDPKGGDEKPWRIVCGFDKDPNLAERDASLNRQKGTRFLPWRMNKDDWGEVPIEQGDWCLFLDPDTNEWVLEDFLGEWWFEKSKRYDHRSYLTHWTGRPHSEESLQKMSETKTGKEGWKWTEEHRQKMLPLLQGIPRTETQIRAVTEYANEKWMCLRTGVVSNFAALCLYQRSIGVSEDYRARIESDPTPDFDLVALIKEVKSRPVKKGALQELAQSLGLPRTTIYKISQKLGCHSSGSFYWSS